MQRRFHVQVGGESGAVLLEACGTDTFPVLSPVPLYADFQGRHNVEMFLLDMGGLDSSAVIVLGDYLVRKFGLDPMQARRAIIDGLPVARESCIGLPRVTIECLL